MKALSLAQPMAWAVFHGKDVENRRWNTYLRGRVMIHASKTFNPLHYNWMVGRQKELGIVAPCRGLLVSGAIIGEADIISVLHIEKDRLISLDGQIRTPEWLKSHSPECFSQWFWGPFGFVLKNPKLYDKPIPCKGKLGFFEPELPKC